MYRLRFAPSPTGYLHVGGARTAIYNWLLARKNKGIFVLRIEDTDKERSSQEFLEDIIDSLRWLGLDWDEGPYFQSKRMNRYGEIARKLFEEGHAYPCFCPPGSRSPTLRDPCRNIPPDEARERMKKEPYALRFRVPDGEVVKFTDLFRGEISFSTDSMEDFVLVRSSGIPTYNLAVVVDDHDMGITHVLRGDDHIANTPKQILLYKALGWEPPEYGHFPVILGPDRKKLSKRHGAVSVRYFREEGYLPEALFNYLTLLGWGSGEDREIFSKEELIEKFSLDRVNLNLAVFDYQKLYWMNGVYLASMKPEKRAHFLFEFLEKEKMGIDQSWKEDPQKWEIFVEVVAELKERIKTGKEINYWAEPYFLAPRSYDEKGVKKFLKEDVLQLWEEFWNRSIEIIRKLHQENKFTPQGKEEGSRIYDSFVRNFCEQNDIKAVKILQPLRIFLTGRTVSPGIFETIYLIYRVSGALGKDPIDEIVFRVNRGLQYWKSLKLNQEL